MDDPSVVYHRDFGYSRQDVLLIDFITIGLPIPYRSSF